MSMRPWITYHSRNGEAYFLIQLYVDSLYVFACWSLCLLCLLMLILIENKSMLIVYWVVDRKLINVYLTKRSTHNINFENYLLFFLIQNYVLFNVHQFALSPLFICTLYSIVFLKKSKSAYRICLYGNAFNANEEMFAGNTDADVSYPDTEYVFLSI